MILENIHTFTKFLVHSINILCVYPTSLATNGSLVSSIHSIFMVLSMSVTPGRMHFCYACIVVGNEVLPKFRPSHPPQKKITWREIWRRGGGGMKIEDLHRDHRAIFIDVTVLHQKIRGQLCMV